LICERSITTDAEYLSLGFEIIPASQAAGMQHQETLRLYKMDSSQRVRHDQSSSSCIL